MARHPIIERRIQHHEEKGIDASAMFYTELECLEEILRERESEKNRPVDVKP